MPAVITTTISGGAELQAALDNVQNRLLRSWIRGAAAEGANEIRTVARTNGFRAGLDVAGYYPTTPGGRRIYHRGMIPISINAWVLARNPKGTATAAIRVFSGGRRTPTQTYHWKFVEFGSIHNPVTRPFWAQSLPQAEPAAVAAAWEVIIRKVNEANNSGKGLKRGAA